MLTHRDALYTQLDTSLNTGSQMQCLKHASDLKAALTFISNQSLLNAFSCTHILVANESKTHTYPSIINLTLHIILYLVLTLLE